MDNRFSFASVILSYFLVGGGMFTATLVGSTLDLRGEWVGLALLAAGAFAGGFVAGRASRGQTILEPAIGAVAVVATIVGLAATTPIGKLIWVMAQDATLQFVGAVGVAGVVGALVGAFISEKMFGEATQSSLPWVVYTAMSVFGACLLATLGASIVFVGNNDTTTSADAVGTVVLIGIAAGCLLAGLAVGSSARTRPLLAAFLGGAVGVAGFFTLVARAAATPASNELAGGIAIMAAGGAIVTVIGTGLAWAGVGRRRAA